MDQITQALQDALERMPPFQRAVAQLRFGERLGTADIAARLGMSTNMVRVHLSNIADALRKELPRLLD